MGWEYLVEFHFVELADPHKDREVLQAYLNDLGKGESWELVCILPIPEEDRKRQGRSDDMNFVFTFKRPRK